MVLIKRQWGYMQTMVANRNRRIKDRKNQKGISILETIPMIFIFVALLGSTLGFFGVTQKMILHSIASRSYGFEQMRNRANLTYLRDVNGGNAQSYQTTQLRYFSVREPGNGAATFVAAKVGVRFPPRRPGSTESDDDHNTSAYGDISRNKRNERHYFDQVWIKVGHGICLTEACGD